MNTSTVKIGYARTSTADQNLEPQIEALEAAGCGMIRTEQKSGTSLTDRVELNTILDFISEGETLVVDFANPENDVDQLRKLGYRVIGREQMRIGILSISFQRWTGRPPIVDDLTEAIEEYLAV